MTNKIIPAFDESKVIDEKKLAKEHNSLVDGLKKSLYMGQVGFIQAGKYLFDIQSKGTYKAEDSAHEHTFADFCDRPDIPIPGRTSESRRRTAYTLMKIYEQLQIKSSLKEEVLAPIGWTKLGLIASYVDRTGEDPEEWIDKAQVLTTKDLELELKIGDKSLNEIMSCEHTNIKRKVIWACPDCHQTYKADPRKAE
jgi:hypothetical protein